MRVQDAIKLYLTSCRNEGLTEGVIKDKERHLGWFSCDKNIDEVTLDDIYECVSSLPITEIRKWRVKIDLRAFFKFLNEHHLSDLTYTLIKNKEPELRVRPDLKEDEFKKMDEIIHALMGRDRRYIKWHALHHFMWETGLRRSELCNIRMDDFDSKTHSFYVKCAKSNRSRQGFYCANLSEYLKEFKPKEFLFETKKREIDYIVESLKKRAGIVRRICPHSYRHAYVTRLLTHGCPLQQTALLAGHVRVDTTAHYYHSVNLQNDYESYINAPKTLELKSNIGIKTKYSVKLSITKS